MVPGGTTKLKLRYSNRLTTEPRPLIPSYILKLVPHCSVQGAVTTKCIKRGLPIEVVIFRAGLTTDKLIFDTYLFLPLMRLFIYLSIFGILHNGFAIPVLPGQSAVQPGNVQPQSTHIGSSGDSSSQPHSQAGPSVPTTPCLCHCIVDIMPHLLNGRLIVRSVQCL